MLGLGDLPTGQVGVWHGGAIGPMPWTQKRYLFNVFYGVQGGVVYDKYAKKERPSITILAMDDEKVTYVDSEGKRKAKYVLTDERVDDDLDAIFGGFGLISRWEDHIYTLFEDEIAPLKPQAFIEVDYDEYFDGPDYPF